MALTLTHKTADFEIEQATKSELLNTVVGTFAGARTAKKEVLVEDAKEVRNRLKKEWEQVEAEKVAKREVALKAEQDAGVVAKIMTNLSTGLCDLMQSRKKVLDDFRAKVQATAEDKDTLCSILSWRAEDVMKAETQLGVLRTLNAFAVKQATVQTHLLEEIMGFLRDDYSERMRNVLRDGYRHNSTSAVSNILHMAEFGGEQYRAVVLKNIIKNIEAELEYGDNRCQHIDDFCW